MVFRFTGKGILPSILRKTHAYGNTSATDHEGDFNMIL